ncbi:MAG: PKD domain-containing protein [Bacteroidia bacterium]
MKALIKIIFILYIILPYTSAYSQNSTKGKDFWFGFLSNFYGPGGSPNMIYITSDRNVNGNISVPGIGVNIPFSVTANGVFSVDMAAQLVEPPQNDGIHNLAIHITACDTITVYAQNAGSASNDATIIYPTESLGDDYRILNINGWPGDWGDEALIVATENNTQIEIIPSVATSGGLPAGVPTVITLNQGQMYQLSHIPGGNNLSGTIIRGVNSGVCKPFAVFSGSICINIGGCVACDHLYEQLLPVSAWGLEYILVPLSNKSQTYYRIIALNNGTSVSINGGAPINLNAGQVHQFSNNVASYVQSNQPIQIMQYAQGNDCDGVGDPFQILMFPIEQTIDNITFNAFVTPLITQYWVNIVAQTSAVANVVLDGNNIAAQFNPVPSNPAFSFARVNITQGNHTLTCPDGVLAYIYGWGGYESFGYCAGASLRDLTNDFTITSVPTCAGNSITFSAISDPNTTNYIWNFGDNTTANGLTVSHTYSNPGTYQVTLTKVNNIGCDKIIQKNVLIMDPPVQIEQNDTVICIGATVNLNIFSNDSIPIYTPTGCGDSLLTYISYPYDSIVWSTGQNTFNISITPTQDTTIYVYAYEGNCIGVDSIRIAVKDIHAQFSVQDNCFGVSSQFNNTSFINNPHQIDSYLWNFGDGNNTTAQNPTHTYGSPGNYNVTLIVSTIEGCSDSITQSINVYDAPVADFETDSVCLGVAILFNNLTSNPLHGNIGNYWWDFGDGSPINTSNWSPNYMYNQSGVFNVSLVVQNSQLNCYDTITKPVRVYANPSAGFSYTDVCLGNVMSLTDSSSIATTDTIVSYLWAFGDGSPTDNNQNTTHLYNNAGAYTVTLIVTGTGGCSDVQTHTVNVYDAPQANFTTSNVCLNTAASFTNTTVSPQHGGMGNFSWNFGDGSPLNTNDWNANHQYTTHGTYQVTLITQNSNLGCADTITLPIIIHPMPVPNFTFVNQCQADAYTFTNTSSIAQGTIASYNWNFGDNSTSTASSPSHTYSSSGNYSVTLTATSDSGCVASITQQVTVYPMPNADFTVNEVCHNSPTEFTSTSSVLPPDNITTYQWLFGDNNSSSQQNPQHTYSSAGLYNATLIVTTNHNCSDTIVLPVTVNPNPVVDFVANKINGCSPLCIDFTQQATISSGVNSQYIWNFGDGNNGNGAVVSNCYTNTTIYNPISRDITLTVVSDKGCSTTVTKPNYITVYPLPVAEFTPIPKETSILDPIIYFENQSLGSNAWLWHFGEANNTGDTISQNPYHTYKDTGIYQVTLISTNQWGCKDTVVHDVVIIGDFAYFIPNTFTPNGDGVNDSFYGKGYGIKEIVFQVFDRWGLLLFETTDVNEGWKGTYQGENCQQDVYVYQVRIVDINNKKHQFRGHVNLIR